MSPRKVNGRLIVLFLSLALLALAAGATAWRMLHRTDDDDVHAAAAEKTAEFRGRVATLEADVLPGLVRHKA